MSRLDEIYQVDAFTDRPFSGNPAAVCPLLVSGAGTHDWPDRALLQALARENNLSETAYFKPSTVPGADYDLRWFTPTVEVQLCGHATLASAFILFEKLGFARPEVRFATVSGILTVRKDKDRYTLIFPAQKLDAPDLAPDGLIAALGATPAEIRRSSRGIYFCVFENEAQVRGLRPDLAALAALDHSVIATAPGTGSDFVSRYFAPHKGVPEDPVTGSAHCLLAPYWAERLGETELFAIQASDRQGRLWCRLRGEHVEISGHAVLVFRGRLDAANWSGFCK